MARPPLPIGTWGEISVSGESGRWRASARYRGRDGRTRTYSRWRKTKGAARQALLDHFAGMQDADRTGELTPESRVSVLLEHWMTSWESSQPRKPATVRAYRSWKARAAALVGDLRIRECTTGRLESVVNAVRESSGLEAGRQVRGVLAQAFAEAVRLDLLPANPAAAVSTRAAGSKEVRALTPGEVSALRAAAREWEEAPSKSRRPWRREIAVSIDVLLGTGVRVGELLGLRWEDVDLSTVPATITVTGTTTRGLDGGTIRQDAPKSERSMRTLYLPGFATRALREHQAKHPGGGPVFPNQYESWWHAENYRSTFNQVRGLAGLDWVTPHSLRRTVATAVYRADGLRNAGDQLGHSSVGVTSKHYVELSHAGPVEVVAVLDALMESVS